MSGKRFAWRQNVHELHHQMQLWTALFQHCCYLNYKFLEVTNCLSLFTTIFGHRSSVQNLQQKPKSSWENCFCTTFTIRNLVILQHDNIWRIKRKFARIWVRARNTLFVCGRMFIIADSLIFNLSVRLGFWCCFLQTYIGKE